jgi:DNA-binding winged helix-turn-helix (wHTH) protein
MIAYHGDARLVYRMQDVPLPEPARVVQFGVFELDSESGELRKGGMRIRVADQSIRVLKCLIARPGEIVTREELVAALWPDGTHVDFENGINVAVKKLRVSLGDSGNSPRYIETLPRKGYRLIVPVIPCHRAVQEISGPTKPSGFSRFRVPKLAGLAVVALFATAIGAPVVWFVSRMPVQPASPQGCGRPSNNTEANAYFAKYELFAGAGIHDLDRAREMLERALQLDPRYGRARVEYGFTHLIMLNAGYSNESSWLYEAEKEIQAGLRDDPSFSHGRTALAAVYLHQGRKEQARHAAEAALRMNPFDIDARHWLAMNLSYSGDIATARKLEGENVIRNGRFFPSRMHLADLARQEGDWDGSIRENERVLEYDPQNSFVLQCLTRT